MKNISSQSNPNIQINTQSQYKDEILIGSANTVIRFLSLIFILFACFSVYLMCEISKVKERVSFMEPVVKTLEDICIYKNYELNQ